MKVLDIFKLKLGYLVVIDKKRHTCVHSPYCISAWSCNRRANVAIWRAGVGDENASNPTQTLLSWRKAEPSREVHQSGRGSFLVVQLDRFINFLSIIRLELLEERVVCSCPCQLLLNSEIIWQPSASSTHHWVIHPRFISATHLFSLCSRTT